MPSELKLPDSAAFMGAWMLDDLTVCDELIHFHKTNTEAKPGAILREGKNEVIKDYKDSFDSKLMFHFPVTQRYIKSLEQVMDLYKEKFFDRTYSLKDGEKIFQHLSTSQRPINYKHKSQKRNCKTKTLKRKNVKNIRRILSQSIRFF
jgi:hypothetical protein